MRTPDWFEAIAIEVDEQHKDSPLVACLVTAISIVCYAQNQAIKKMSLQPVPNGGIVPMKEGEELLILPDGHKIIPHNIAKQIVQGAINEIKGN